MKIYQEESFRSEMLKRLRHGIVRLIAPTLYYAATHDADMVPRPMITFIKEKKGSGLIGAEIGVYKGENSESIMKTLNIKKLYLIDPYKEGQSYSHTFVVAKEDAVKRLSKYEDKIQFIELTSDEAVNQIPDDLDFVYIDGNHDYESVKRDITNYYPKVKEGGVIGGHDFNNSFLDVVRAACEFSKGMKLYSRLADWWVIKDARA